MRSRIHVITAIALATACTVDRRRTPDDTMVVLTETAMQSADPRFAISSLDSKLARLVAAGLTAIDTPTLEPRLDLAQKLDYVDPTTVEITLRDDARFSDGAPVTAADVAWTYSTVLAEDSKSLHHKGFTERYERVEVVGPRRVRIKLKQPLATLLSDLDFGILSEKTGRGAGPFALRELTTAHALLDANPYYHGERPRVAHVDIMFVRDAAARILMLAGGSADLIQNAVRMDLIEEVRGRPRVRVETAPSVILTYLMMNNADKLLADVRVRRAIAHAIDRTSIIAVKFGGHARPATGLLPELHWAYNGDVARYAYDPAKAKQLLDEAGLRDPDGDGPLPRITLVYKTSSDAFRIALARVIAAQLARVGIAVDVRSFEFATFFADIKKGSYQLASMQSAELNEPDYYYFYFHSVRIPGPANPDGGNRWRYRSAELDRLAEAGRQEMDPAKRKAIYADAQRVVAADVPIVPLWHEDNVVLTNTDVTGYTITPNARLIGLASASKP